MAGNINRVIITGNLTRDPELSALPSGMSVCSLRVACNGRRRNARVSGRTTPNYFDVSVWGAAGRELPQVSGQGASGVAIDGRLDWREWTDKESRQKRQAVDIIAETVQFLGGRDDAASGNGNGFSSSVQCGRERHPDRYRRLRLCADGLRCRG